jgi:hypothetical protein
MPAIPPPGEKDLPGWSQQFLIALEANKTLLGLTTPQLLEISNLVSTYNGYISDKNTARGTYQKAVEDTMGAQKALLSAERTLIQWLQTNPNMTDGLRRALGIAQRGDVTRNTPPNIVSDMTATPSAQGFNTVKWKPNGNKRPTTYRVEVWYGGTGTWQLVGETTRSKIVHTGQTPGRTASYRVTAIRANMVSLPSEIVTVYQSAPTSQNETVSAVGNGPEEQSDLKAA